MSSPFRSIPYLRRIRYSEGDGMPKIQIGKTKTVLFALSASCHSGHRVFALVLAVP